MTEFLEEFQGFRKILCICPCCGELTRVSDLKLIAKGTVNTWLDVYERKEMQLVEKEEKFGEIEVRLREIAVGKGRKEAEKIFNSAVLPYFSALKLDPFDVKPILNPIDFVVFKGMNKKNLISDIVFLSKKSAYSSLNTIRSQIGKVIAEHKYEWQVARINEDGNLIFE